MDENRESGRVSLGLSVVIRVTLRDGVYHEVMKLTNNRVLSQNRILGTARLTMQNPRRQPSKRQPHLIFVS
jgi:hypothetical protein